MKSAIAIVFAAAALAAIDAPAQSYPQKTVRIVVPYAPGGNTDFTARVIAAKLTEVFGQQVVVDNRPGGGTNMGSQLAAKANPGKLNYASSGLGSSNMMAGELLKLMAGVNIVHVPYKGNAPALTDTTGGQGEKISSGVPALLPHIKSGRLRAIAIGSLKRFPALPDVPTIDASGLKGYEATTWVRRVAPAKTPQEIVTRLNV